MEICSWSFSVKYGIEKYVQTADDAFSFETKLCAFFFATQRKQKLITDVKTVNPAIIKVANNTDQLKS